MSYKYTHMSISCCQHFWRKKNDNNNTKDNVHIGKHSYMRKRNYTRFVCDIVTLQKDHVIRVNEYTK